MDTVHCHTPFGYSGISVLWYSMFVGMPLFGAVFIGLFTLPIGIKGLVHGQFPPRGVKVLRPTKILTGWRANLKSGAYVSIPIFLILFSIWGYFQVDKMPQEIKNPDYSVCESKQAH
ncbi:hypothetical protein [Shewanella sedimentimangrovi]|uniref:Uncharacterized protein n=1 Tax=Shewanella sedimentimangrovi TaxID=2814293 RepID=A0ABX7R4G8_9GAMM|nr:hypothetical protein [Shewanella sedimentimangrovi]QSX38619.1 hypothetical protein JYB85_07345 [Shewanella sedimentimangrovi]